MSDRVKPRLAYLVSQYPAPSHTFIRREIAALRQRGWFVKTLSVRLPPFEMSGSEEAASTFYVLDGKIHRLAAAHLRWAVAHPLGYARALRLAMRHRAPGPRGLALAFAHFLEAVLVARELQSNKIDHLHNHFANSAATVGMIAAKLSGAGWSFTMHGISETDYPAGILLKRKIEAADWVACASWFMRAQGLRTIDPNDWDKLHVIRCGIPVQELPKRRRTGSGVRIICVGRLSAEKGQAGLLSAFAVAAKSNPLLSLRLVGDGPLRASLEKLAEQLGITDRVDFAGALPERETLEAIAQADLLVVSSFLEGLPVVLLEAMAIGVAVIAPAVAGIPELLTHQKNGFLFAPSNWEELRQCITTLAADSKLRAKLEKSARETIRSDFEIEGSTRKLGRLFSISSAAGSAGSQSESEGLSFGLREAIILSLAAIALATAVAIRDQSASGPQPLPGSAVERK